MRARLIDQAPTYVGLIIFFAGYLVWVVELALSSGLTPSQGAAVAMIIGLSVMLASRQVIDTDRDLVFDDDDDCAATPLGALVDPRGCPTDADGDEVPDGLDRCPATPAGATVNAAGCPQDADADNVADGIDRCADTPAGAAVDQRGCPLDGDADGVFDGLDRCPDTPKDASVDQLGCPGDEDSDGVLDGLDRCPRTPAGTRVNTFGCPPGVERATGGTLLPGSRRVAVLELVLVVSSSRRLQQDANPDCSDSAAC